MMRSWRNPMRRGSNSSHSEIEDGAATYACSATWLTPHLLLDLIVVELLLQASALQTGEENSSSVQRTQPASMICLCLANVPVLCALTPDVSTPHLG